MARNDAFDAKVLDAIKKGNVRARAIADSMDGGEVRGAALWLQIDYALQRLKKKGLIAFTHKAGWAALQGGGL